MSKFPESLLAPLLLAALGCGNQTAAPVSFPATALMSVASASGDCTVSVKTSPTQPPGRGVVAVQYTFTGASGAPLSGVSSVDVVPWMPAMGHGTSVTPTVEDQGNGVFVVSEVYFYMPGQWDLRTHMNETASADDVTPSFEIP